MGLEEEKEKPLSPFLEMSRALGGVESAIRNLQHQFDAQVKRLDDKIFNNPDSHEKRLKKLENLYQRALGVVLVAALLLAKGDEIVKWLKALLANLS